MNRHAYLAPGSGLGHVTRALAICLRLRRDFGVEMPIVTDSPFAKGLAGLARFPFVEVDDVAGWVRVEKPRAVVTDTFPLACDALQIHLARRLKRPSAVPAAELIVELEPLSGDHREALSTVRCPRVALDGPVVLDPSLLPARSLPRELDRDGLSLVVHSGPAEEVRQLVALEPAALVLSPWCGLEHFPASVLYSKARRILTGAGYNSMAELLAHRGKHTAIAFERHYDDQAARLREFYSDPQADGTQRAVEAILSLIG